MRSIRECKNLKGKTVLMRADFNVPIENNRVVDDFRIRKTLPTLFFLTKKGASVIIISHSDLKSDTQSLKPVALVLNKYISTRFINKSVPSKLDLKPGEVVLLENIRLDKGEKKNSVDLAKRIARLGDVYVNDAFPVSHRAHASIVGVPKYLPHYAGFQFEEEVKKLSLVLQPTHPFLFILGGAKFETKMPLITKFLKTADHVVIAGALMNNFFKESGFEVGQSLVEKKDFGLKKLLKNPKLLLPIDITVTQKSGGRLTESIADISSKDSIVDIGPRTIYEISMLIAKAKLVLWNGPTGKYEDGFDVGTIKLLKILAESRAKTIIGGGDTAALVNKLHLADKFTFVSTGGGATLEFLAKGTLPGIKALR